MANGTVTGYELVSMRRLEAGSELHDWWSLDEQTLAQWHRAQGADGVGSNAVQSVALEVKTACSYTGTLKWQLNQRQRQLK